MTNAQDKKETVTMPAWLGCFDCPSAVTGCRGCIRNGPTWEMEIDSKKEKPEKPKALDFWTDD